LHPTQRLLDFFGHYNRLIEERRHKELVSDFRANQGAPKVPFSNLLKQDASLYTLKVFKWFEEEYGLFLNCILHDGFIDGSIHE